MTKRKRPLDKSREALTPVTYGTDDIAKEKSLAVNTAGTTSVEGPKRLTFTELAEELTRRSNLE